MSTITEHLVPKLQARFAGRPMRLSDGHPVVVVFPAAHPDFGDIEVEDSGNELTITFGRFTHCHIDNYDSHISASERAERIAEECVSLLEEVFADRVEFFGSHRDGGGFTAEVGGAAPDTSVFRWSGPVSDDG